ncbi:ATP-grasp domain-containing protein [Rubrivivax gelatinosus]|uniref:ATP-grasp domain-containing protein n=1 Tax=Rubrivivax gelatinosus TaxID=28068 RepID=UPI0002FE561B|nr:ATP-grasp domain-containing protein [Rubrivivax gelatinosus]MBG6079388.1 FMN phosphatase YigB (HAD superfamily) [Rubrivivax gelatinosus]
MNVFFLNVGRRCELVEAFARALPAVSPGLIWGSDPNPLAPALAVVDRRVELPTPIDSDHFLNALCDFLVRESIDLVIPTIDPDLVRLDRWRDQIAERAPQARLLVSPSSVIRIARDKRLSRDAFAALGAEVPEAVDPNAPDLVFPLFIKPASGSASIGAVRVNDAHELRARLAETADPMVERLIGGDETTVDVLLDMSGRALCAVPRRRLQVRGGEVTRGVVERSPELEARAMAIASGLGCIGPVTVQFRNPAPGRWVAMELNARMGGGLPLAIGAGADWPRWILQMATGRTPSVAGATVHDGMIMTRTDRSIFLPPARLVVQRGLDAPLPPVIVFDMDDTLYPEADFVRSGHRAVAERVWQDLRVDIEPELRRRFAAGQRGDLMSAALTALDVEAPQDYVDRVLVPVYREHVPAIRPHVETVPVLTELRARGHRLALLSDGWADVQRRKLAALDMAGLFDEIVITDELGRHAWKPSPVGFERILTALGVAGDAAMYVSDNPHKDFAGPHRLGMHTVRIVRPGTEHGEALAPAPEHQPQRVIRALHELLAAPAR